MKAWPHACGTYVRRALALPINTRGKKDITSVNPRARCPEEDPKRKRGYPLVVSGTLTNYSINAVDTPSEK